MEPYIDREALIIRKEIAQKMKEENGKMPISVEAKPTPASSTMTVPKKRIIRKIALRVNAPWDKLSELVRGAFNPLSHEGAQISLEVKIEAQSEQGIKRDTLDPKIKETSTQIGAKVLEEKEE
jgi:hypothetical protein